MLEYISSAAIVILVLAFVCGIGALVLKLMFKERKLRQERCEALAAHGFAQCPEQIDYLEKMLLFLSGMEDTDRPLYTVSMPMKREHSGETIFHFWMKRNSNSDSSSAWEESFLFPFKRRTDQPVMLMMSDQKVPPRIMKFLGKLLEKALGGRMGLLDLPRELQGGAIMAAFGPPDASLYDLLDSATISEVVRGADTGIAAFRAHQDWAAASVDPKKASPDITRLWAHVQRLAALR